jgi:hypothetical protein
MASGNAPPLLLPPRAIGRGCPLTQTVISCTATFQNKLPITLLYVILDGSGTRDGGWAPMPKYESTVFEPGRCSESERKRAAGADVEGVIPNKLDGRVAPSGLFDVTVGIACAMTELRGSASPRMPEKRELRGSLSTEVAADRAWLEIVYPPISTRSHTMGPLTVPLR